MINDIRSKKIQIALVFIFIGILFASVNFTSFAVQSDQVDIGLVFGANNQFPVGVTSEQGFNFGSVEGGNFVPILNLVGTNNLIFYKDGFFNSTGAELVTTEQAYYTNGQVKGGYHIQVGQAFETYEAGLDQYAKIIALFPNAYLVFDDGWRIFTGFYISQAEAVTQLDLIKNGVPGYDCTIAEPNPSRIIVGTKEKILFGFDSTEKEFVFKSDIFETNAIKYRNSFIIKRLVGSDFTLINRVTMNEYLYGILPKEMSGDWPIEALKAQAIAAKNYAYTISTKHAAYGFDLCNTINCQVYGGYSAEKPLSNRAVDETEDYVLTYGGEIIPLYYHSHSGGITDNSEDVWNLALPYIRSTQDPYSIGSPNTDWTATLNHADIEQKLIVGGYNVGSLKFIRILERYASGRVSKIEFEGTLGKATFTKEKVRTILGGSIIKSSLFSFDSATAKTTIGASGGIATGTFVPTEPVTNNTQTNNQATSPVVVRSNAGIYAKFVDPAHLLVTENGQERSQTLDKEALRNAKDIYTTVNQSYVPYLYSSTEIIDMSSGSVIFYGHGYGHGLGMSQWGAKKMAEEGMTFEEILKFYYKDTQLSLN